MFDVSLTLRAVGAAGVDEAWDRYVTVQRWPQWSPQISRVEADGRRLAPGRTGRVFGPLGVHVGFVVDDVDDLRRTWTWHVRTGPVRLRLHHTVTGTAAGTETTLRVTGPAPVVLAYAPVAQLALGRLVRP